MDTLFEWQQPSCDKLTDILRTKTVAFDHSNTGAGKTYIGLQVAKDLGQIPNIICPKAARSTWRRVSEAMGIPIGVVTNPEQVKAGHTELVTPISKKNFRWNLPAGSLVIVDEAHRFGGRDTANAVLLAQTRQYGVKVLALSATMSDKGPLGLRALGYLAGLHGFTKASFYDWSLRNGCFRDIWSGVSFMTGPKRLVHLANIQKQLAPFSVKLTIEQIPGFPENIIVPELIDIAEDKLAEVNRLYAELPDYVRNPGAQATGLTIDLRARQCSEVAKIPYLADSVEDCLAEGRSAAVFLCFLKSISMLRTELKKRGWESGEVSGNIKDTDRDVAVDKFQTDKLRVMVNQIASGGLSISMHHTETSQYPRTAFVCPGYSAVDFVQALGRCPRTGGLSKVVTKVVLLAGSPEEKVYKAIERKLNNIKTLTDAALMGQEED